MNKSGNTYGPNNNGRNNILGVSRNNTSTSNNKGGFTGTNVFGIVLGVVVLMIVVSAGYWFYKTYTNKTFQTYMETEVMSDVKDAASTFNIGNSSIPTSSYSNEYSISMWLNIDNYTYNYGKEKVILCRGIPGSGNPEIVLGDKNNDLIVRLKLQTPMGSTTTGNINKSNFVDIPVQNVAQEETLARYQTNDNVHMNNVFKKIQSESIVVKDINQVGSNRIDYSQIKPQIATGCDNVLTTLQPRDALTIGVQQDISIKEAFTDMAQINSDKIADNSAPVESHKFNDEYFSMISGNTVSNDLTEKFETAPTAVSATATPTTTATTNTTTVPATTQPQVSNAGVASAAGLVESYTKDPTVGSCVYHSIPLQRWVHVIVSVYNQVVDIFIDGQLASSCVLKGFPALSTSNVQLTPNGGFAGKISRVTFSNTAMTTEHARVLYYNGPVPSSGILSMIPNWVWYSIIFIIIITIGYSYIL